MPATTTNDRPSSARDPRLAPWRAFVRAQAQVSCRLDELQKHGCFLTAAPRAHA